MSVAKIKTAFASLFNFQPRRDTRDFPLGTKIARGSVGDEFREAFKTGKINDLIEKAEIDYASGKALDRLY